MVAAGPHYRVRNGNYARCASQRPDMQARTRETSWNSTERPEKNLAGDSHTTAHYCGLDIGRAPIMAYSEWSEITAEVWKRIFVAALFTVFVQWGTTGPGILIAYYTPTRGIGCRSGGYALYGGLLR